jgi:hypothetical protein
MAKNSESLRTSLLTRACKLPFPSPTSALGSCEALASVLPFLRSASLLPRSRLCSILGVLHQTAITPVRFFLAWHRYVLLPSLATTDAQALQEAAFVVEYIEKAAQPGTKPVACGVFALIVSYELSLLSPHLNRTEVFARMLTIFHSL